jgi:hypothetical protein
MKKSMIFLVLAVMLLFVGCDAIGIDVSDSSSSSQQSADQGPQASSDTKGNVSGEQSVTPAPQDTEAEALTDADFTITVDGLSFTIGTDPTELIETFGDGGANEDNNFGFIGWDDTNTYKYFRHDYDGFSIAVKTDVAASTSGISQIGLIDTATSRDVAPGDSREDMVAQYGEPDEEKTDEGMTDCVYRSGDRTITFVLNPDGVIGFINID